MKNYTEHFNLRQFVKFDTNVEKVTAVPAEEKWQQTSWDVLTKDLITNETETTRCYSVVVCTGQFHTPYYPNITGIENFPGRVIHSHRYRKPEEFANQTVLILGASFAGTEITLELSPYVKTIYLSQRHDKLKGELPSNVIKVAGLEEADSQHLILKDGSKIQADSVIFCTGYENDMPFLDASTGVEVMPKYMYPLYNQVINVNNPTMGFVGLLPKFGAFCPKFYAQANYYMSFLQNKFQLPSREIMLENADKFSPKKLKDVKEDWYWDYINQLACTGSFPALPAYYSQGFMQWMKFRECNLLHFKEYDLRVDENSRLKVINPNCSQQAVELETACKS